MQLTNRVAIITGAGRCFEAVDDFSKLPPKIPAIMASDAYTLRRMEPA